MTKPITLKGRAAALAHAAGFKWGRQDEIEAYEALVQQLEFDQQRSQSHDEVMQEKCQVLEERLKIAEEYIKPETKLWIYSRKGSRCLEAMDAVGKEGK